MKLIGLKLMLRYGHFLGVQVTEEFAAKTIEEWKAGKLPLILTGKEARPGGCTWAVPQSEIVGLHTFDWAVFEKALQQQGGAGGYKPPAGSGYGGRN